MPDRASFDYAPIRVVPLVERGEFLNAGIILFCRTKRFLEARVDLEPDRLAAVAPHLDLAEVFRHLEVIPRIAAGDPSAGPMSELPQAGRFHWLVAPRSTVVQVGPVHCGICDDPADALDDLMNRLVRLPNDAS
jgi:hypothetical protein